MTIDYPSSDPTNSFIISLIYAPIDFTCPSGSFIWKVKVLMQTAYQGNMLDDIGMAGLQVQCNDPNLTENVVVSGSDVIGNT